MLSLNSEEIAKVFEETHRNKPYWEYDSDGMFQAMSKATLKKMFLAIEDNIPQSCDYCSHADVVKRNRLWKFYNQLKQETEEC